jgi:hypothetical protein
MLVTGSILLSGSNHAIFFLRSPLSEEGVSTDGRFSQLSSFQFRWGLDEPTQPGKQITSRNTENMKCSLFLLIITLFTLELLICNLQMAKPIPF